MVCLARATAGPCSVVNTTRVESRNPAASTAARIRPTRTSISRICHARVARSRRVAEVSGRYPGHRDPLCQRQVVIRAEGAVTLE